MGSSKESVDAIVLDRTLFGNPGEKHCGCQFPPPEKRDLWLIESEGCGSPGVDQEVTYFRFGGHMSDIFWKCHPPGPSEKCPANAFLGICGFGGDIFGSSGDICPRFLFLRDSPVPGCHEKVFSGLACPRAA